MASPECHASKHRIARHHRLFHDFNMRELSEIGHCQTVKWPGPQNSDYPLVVEGPHAVSCTAPLGDGGGFYAYWFTMRTDRIFRQEV